MITSCDALVSLLYDIRLNCGRYPHNVIHHCSVGICRIYGLKPPPVRSQLASLSPHDRWVVVSISAQTPPWQTATRMTRIEKSRQKYQGTDAQLVRAQARTHFTEGPNGADNKISAKKSSKLPWCLCRGSSTWLQSNWSHHSGCCLSYFGVMPYFMECGALKAHQPAVTFVLGEQCCSV